MASTGEAWRLGRRPALDGLRGIAILLVVAHHADVLPRGGSIGVPVFFTLSGFLITSLLLTEHAATGRVSLRAFYRRRVLRLAPALLVFVAVMAAVGVAVSPLFAQPQHVPIVLAYGGNWYEAFHGNGTLGGLSHTWSLAVEEQFYILWPLVLIAALRHSGPRAVMWVALVGAGASAAARLLLWDPAWTWRVEFGFDTRADALLIGCALAAWMRQRPHGRSRPTFAVLAGAGLALLLVPGLTHPLWMMALTPVLSALMLWATCAGRESAGGGLLARAPLAAVGKRSYSWYLWHVPLVWIMSGRMGLPLDVGIALMVAVSWVLACLSYRFVELPFLGLKDSPRGSDGTVGSSHEEVVAVVRGRAGERHGARDGRTHRFTVVSMGVGDRTARVDVRVGGSAADARRGTCAAVEPHESAVQEQVAAACNRIGVERPSGIPAV